MKLEVMTIPEKAELIEREFLEEFEKLSDLKGFSLEEAKMMRGFREMLGSTAKHSFTAGASFALLMVVELIDELDENKSFKDRFYEAIEAITVGSKEIRNENVKRKRKEKK